MTSNFNRHFLLIDFGLLDAPRFRKFLASAESVTYIMLRRHIWRGTSAHHMGLDRYYLDQRKLACSLQRNELSKTLSIRPAQVSLHLAKLREWGVVEPIQTGRQSVFVLGEWLDVRGDGSYRGIEWFYLDRQFGISKDDALKTRTADVRKMRTPDVRQTEHLPSAIRRHQESVESGLRPVAYEETVNGNGNSEETNVVGNKRKNTVTVRQQGKKHPVNELPTLNQPAAKSEHLAQEISGQLGDKHSLKFYRLVARRVPEQVIRRTLAELKADGADNPPRVFTYRMGRYAENQLAQDRLRKVEKLKSTFGAPR